MAFERFVSSCFLFNPLTKSNLVSFHENKSLEFFLLMVFLFTFLNRNRVVYHQRKRRTEKLIKCKQRRGFFCLTPRDEIAFRKWVGIKNLTGQNTQKPFAFEINHFFKSCLSILFLCRYR